MELIVLGVDGVDPELLEKAIEQRECGNWARLKEEAFYTELPSTVPAVTVPAWVSMFSGYSPGHFDAYHLSQADYAEWRLDFPSSEKFRGDFFWDRIDHEVGLHYVPGTSPVYEVNGWMRGGFPSPRDFEFYPRELEEEFGDLERENSGSHTTSGAKIAAEYRNYETERRIAEKLFEKSPGVFVSVVRMTDQASHYAEKESQLLDCYEKVDEEIGKYVRKAEENDAKLLVVSDHGFFHASRKFNISRFLEQNQWLETTGTGDSLLYRLAEPLLDTPLKKYLKYVHDYLQSSTGKDIGGTGGDVLSTIEKSSKVLPMHFGLGKDCVLKIHTEDMPYGSVGKEEKQRILEQLEQELRELERDGDKVVEKVWRAEELYGEDAEADLAFRTTGKFIVETAPSSKLFARTSTFTHRENGVFFAKGSGIDTDAEKELEITDVAPLIYALLDQKIPGDLDGSVPEKLVPETRIEKGSREVEELEV